MGDRDARRQVVDAVHILERRPQERDVVDVAAGEMDRRPQGSPIAAAEVVDDAHFVALAGQMICQRGTQKTGPSGY